MTDTAEDGGLEAMMTAVETLSDRTMASAVKAARQAFLRYYGVNLEQLEAFRAGTHVIVSAARHLAMRAVEAAGETARWRRIAEAPLDGTPVLVAVAGSDYWPCTAFFQDGDWRYSCEEHALSVTPTHWAPLPETPAAGDARVNGNGGSGR